MMEKKFFKQHFEGDGHEWTIYGCYDETDITPQGDILCVVDDVDSSTDDEHIRHTIYQNYCDPDEITHISEDEYNAVINKLREVDGYYNKADELLKTLI